MSTQSVQRRHIHQFSHLIAANMSSNAEDHESQRPAQSEENETSHSSGKPTNAPSKEALEGPQSSAPTKKFEYERAPGGMYTAPLVGISYAFSKLMPARRTNLQWPRWRKETYE